MIRLVNASAVDAAKLLDEMYNGVRPQPQTQPQNPFEAMMRRGFPQPQPQQPAVEPRIRVVADPNTNSLLVRASPVDMLAIRRHIRETIDSGVVDSNAVIKTHVLPPLRYANANEVAQVIQNVYREFMSPEVRTTNNRQRGPGGRFGPFQPILDNNGNARDVALSIGVDDRTNSIILACSEKLFTDVKKLVDHLDDQARDATKTIKVVPLVGLDPALAQQAIDAIQGRPTTPATGGTFGGNNMFSPFGPRFGGGNFGNMGGRFGGGQTGIGMPAIQGFGAPPRNQGGFNRGPGGGGGGGNRGPGGGGNRGQTVAALLGIVSTLRARGYRLVTVTRILGERFRWEESG